MQVEILLTDSLVPHPPAALPAGSQAVDVDSAGVIYAD